MQRYIAGVQTGVLDMVRISSVSPTHLLPRASALGKLTDLWWQKNEMTIFPRLTLCWTSTRPVTRGRASRGRSRGWRSTPTSTKRPWRMTWQWSPWEPRSLLPLAELHQSEQSCKKGFLIPAQNSKLSVFQSLVVWLGLNLWLWTNIWLEKWGPHFFFLFFQEPIFCNFFLQSSSSSDIFSTNWFADLFDWVWKNKYLSFLPIFGTNLCFLIFATFFPVFLLLKHLFRNLVHWQL